MTSPVAATTPVRIAIIGSGKMAAVHAANVAVTGGAQLAAVAGGSGAEQLAARFGTRVMTVEAACADAGIDAVVIASPNALHAEHIQFAAKGGKAVLVEKPVDLDIDRVDECIRAVGSAADRVVVAFNRRFDPSFSTLRARVDAGEIGDVAQLIIVSRDPVAPPLDYVPASGGLFRDMTIHDLDLARYLVGDILSVTATGQALDPEIARLGDFSGAAVTLVAESGAIVTIVNSRSNASGYDQRVEAFGPGGTLSVVNPSQDQVVFSGRDLVGSRSRLVSHYADRYRDAYRAEIAHLVAVATGDAAPVATLGDGREALVLADAATASARAHSLVRR